MLRPKRKSKACCALKPPSVRLLWTNADSFGETFPRCGFPALAAVESWSVVSGWIARLCADAAAGFTFASHAACVRATAFGLAGPTSPLGRGGRSGRSGGGDQQEEALIFSETSGSDLATRKRRRPPPRRMRSTALEVGERERVRLREAQQRQRKDVWVPIDRRELTWEGCLRTSGSLLRSDWSRSRPGCDLRSSVCRRRQPGRRGSESGCRCRWR